jgi:uncharacterized protein
MTVSNNWKLSRYTSVIECSNNELLLHNSFMGAVARIPADKAANFKWLIDSSINKSSGDNEVIRELYQGGFIVDRNLDEKSIVTKILDKERETSRFSLIIMPHENCNFRCIYCYEDFKRDKMPRSIIEGLKIFVKQNVEKYKRLNVAWFGGEPLLASETILELNDYFTNICEKDGIKFSSTMTTNGYLLTPDVADELIKSNIKGFQITLDGPAHIHNIHRKLAGGGETYNRILNNLVALKNRDDDFLVRLRVNMDNASIFLIEQWLDDDLAPLFANDGRFALSFDVVGRWGGPNDATLDVCTADVASPIKLRLMHKSLRLGFSDKIVKGYLAPHGNVCYASRDSSLVIGADGTVYKCTVAFNDPRNVVGKLQADGRMVLNPSLLSLWTALDSKDTTWCETCHFYPSCQSRKCPLIAIKENKPNCPMTKEMYETLVKLVAYGKEPVLP